MKIQIEKVYLTKSYIWSLEDGPENVNKYSGFSDTLGGCFEEIIRYRTIDEIDYEQ